MRPAEFPNYIKFASLLIARPWNCERSVRVAATGFDYLFRHLCIWWKPWLVLVRGIKKGNSYLQALAHGACCNRPTRQEATAAAKLSASLIMTIFCSSQQLSFTLFCLSLIHTCLRSSSFWRDYQSRWLLWLLHQTHVLHTEEADDDNRTSSWSVAWSAGCCPNDPSTSLELQNPSHDLYKLLIFSPIPWSRGLKIAKMPVGWLLFVILFYISPSSVSVVLAVALTRPTFVPLFSEG